MARARAHNSTSKGRQGIKPSIISDAGDVARHAAKLRGSAKSRVLKATSVPLPILTYKALTRRWSVRREKSFIREVRYNAKLWQKHAPNYRISGAYIDTLSARPKPSNEGKLEAQKTIDGMASWDSDACSAKFCDEEGTLLAAYFAKRIVRRSAGQRRVDKVSVFLTGQPSCLIRSHLASTNLS
ncbi:hypothetical protein BDR04DRAFT_1163647 [Suillus decipiens]|nr:hypothetical protein BDR04DRAFT_1163647 [Suillus decipiens]